MRIHSRFVRAAASLLAQSRVHSAPLHIGPSLVFPPLVCCSHHLSYNWRLPWCFLLQIQSKARHPSVSRHRSGSGKLNKESACFVAKGSLLPSKRGRPGNLATTLTMLLLPAAGMRRSMEGLFPTVSSTAKTNSEQLLDMTDQLCASSSAGEATRTKLPVATFNAAVSVSQ